MAWGSKQTATQITSITTEQFFSETITLNPGELVHLQFTADFPASPTDHAVFSVYSTLDDSTENWDTTPIAQVQVSNNSDPSDASYILRGIYKVRVGVKRSGSTDTITSADLAWRKDGVSL